MRRRTFLLGGAAVVAAVALPVGAIYRRQIGDARARLDRPVQVTQTRSGPMEWAEDGSGPPLMILHGTGGGWDQGLAMGGPLIPRGWRVIAPSRFGYLGTPMPEDASSEAQADALVDLLDALGIERIPVIGGSAGALPALAFAIRHPDRISALVPLVPAVWAPGHPEGAPPPKGLWLMQAALKSDLLFWSMLKLAPGRMTQTLLATDPALVAAASPEEQARVAAIRDGLLPVSRRAEGLINDAMLAGRPAKMPVERITAPTLAAACRDDGFDTFAGASYIAATVPGARLLEFPSGGHIWVGHNDEMFDGIDAFLREVLAV